MVASVEEIDSMTVKSPRVCLDCDVDISHLHSWAIRCPTHASEHKKKLDSKRKSSPEYKERQKKQRAARKKEEQKMNKSSDPLIFKKDAERLDVDCDRCGRTYYTDARAVRHGSYNTLCPKCRQIPTKKICQAITLAGKRCQNSTSYGSDKFCGVHIMKTAHPNSELKHSNMNLYDPDPKPCISISSITNKPCLNYATKEHKYCYKHLVEQEKKRRIG